jgi:hypothetical protein
MNKIISLAFILCFAAVAFALPPTADGTVIIPPAKRSSSSGASSASSGSFSAEGLSKQWGLKIIAGVASLGGNNTQNFDGPIAGKGYAVGAGIVGVLQFGTAFAFAPEATVAYRVTGKGTLKYTKYDEGDAPHSFSQEGTFSEVGVDIPLMARVSFQVIPVWLELGPQLGFSFNAKVGKSIAEGGTGVDADFERELFDFGGAVGLGGRILDKYEISVRASRYITDYVDGRDWALWQAQLGFAYLF